MCGELETKRKQQKRNFIVEKEPESEKRSLTSRDICVVFVQEKANVALTQKEKLFMDYLKGNFFWPWS
jgi:hypothetical protein